MACQFYRTDLGILRVDDHHDITFGDRQGTIGAFGNLLLARGIERDENVLSASRPEGATRHLNAVAQEDRISSLCQFVDTGPFDCR